MAKEMLKVEDVAERLSIHWQTVLDLIKRGELDAVKLGKGYRIDASALGNFIESRSTSKKILATLRTSKRMAEILKEGEFGKRRAIGLSATPLPETQISDIFSHVEGENKDVISLLENPPVFRRGGWSLETMDRPKPVLGEYLETRNGDRKVVRIYRDGQVLAVGLADGEFLGHAMQKYDDTGDENSINGLAVAEFISNFCIFSGELAKFWNPSPESVVFEVRFWNPAGSKVVNRFVMGDNWPFPEVFGSTIRVKEKTLQTEISLKGSSLDAKESATKLWKEYGYLFGMRDDEIPYLNREDQLLDFRMFKKQR